MKGLIIDEPWISLILSGDKTWEMRSTATQQRGLVALIRKGSGTVVGVARVTGSRGPLSLTDLRSNAEKHRVPMNLFESGQAQKWTTAWELADARPLGRAIRYSHPFGAVIWVQLDAGVEAQVSAQLEDERIQVLGTRFAPSNGGLTTEKNSYSLDPSLPVPVANDGTWFGPHLIRAGQFTIGEKGAEQRVDSFEEALGLLRAMSVPRWRRPNAQGNWGIVSGIRWLRACEVQSSRPVPCGNPS